MQKRYRKDRFPRPFLSRAGSGFAENSPIMRLGLPGCGSPRALEAAALDCTRSCSNAQIATARFLPRAVSDHPLRQFRRQPHGLVMYSPFVPAALLPVTARSAIVPRPTDEELRSLDNPPPDVRAILDRFFPAALAWYQKVEADLLPTGRALSSPEAAFAAHIGVKNPALVRIVILDEFPLPADRELRMAAEQIGLGSRAEGGRTNGCVILLKPRTARNNSVISHELVHVAQQDRLGRAVFLRRYLTEMVIMGYARSPLELEANAGESASLEVPGHNE